MTLTAGDKLFLDANVLVYSRVTGSAFHAASVLTLASCEAAGVELWTSRQVLREFLAAVTRGGPGQALLPLSTAIADVNGFEARFQILEDGPDVTAELLSLLGQVPCGGKQVHDANIAATMIARGVPNLLTNNVADFTRFAPHIAVIPL